MNKKALVKALKSSIWIVLPGTFLSLQFCTLMLGKGVFEMMMPVWLVIIFTTINFVFARISFIANRLWLKIIISAMLITATVIFIRIMK